MSENSFVTIGVKHFKNWTISGKSMKGTSGAVKKYCNILCSCVVRDGKAYVGASDGSLQVWQGSSITKSVKVHSGAIHALCLHEDKLLTGSSD